LKALFQRIAKLGAAMAVSAGMAGAASPISITGEPQPTGARPASASTTPAFPNAQAKVPGFAAPNALFTGLVEWPVAQGSMRTEGGDANTSYYGYNGNGSFVPLAGSVQSPGHNVEANKTEPDKNTYLVLSGQHGPDAAYDYGTHFLYQGHETGLEGYITRINLDADLAHRVTVMARQLSGGGAIPTIDGSTWDPFAQRLLFTTESGSNASVMQATLDYPSTVEDISGSLGRAGYEGIQNDSAGNLLIVEDVGGAKGASAAKHAKQPNSFVYRFVPKDPSNLKNGGRLQALQAISIANAGTPISFHAGAADADILSQDVKDLHTYGKVFTTHWVTLHDTDTDGTSPFDANALAKSRLATPFKRPENGQFRPGSNFGEFYFDETGDTDLGTEAGMTYGGFGSVMKLTYAAGSDDGTLALFYLCNFARSGFDNVAFADDHRVVFVEDAGDTLHKQRGAFDSAYVLSTDHDYSAGEQPIRMLALGRDPSATIDSSLLDAGAGFQNEGDNEITGFHISDGDPTTGGILGAKIPTPYRNGWRVFYTQQHGDNVTWEIGLLP
jgi:hypothetical protein